MNEAQKQLMATVLGMLEVVKTKKKGGGTCVFLGLDYKKKWDVDILKEAIEAGVRVKDFTKPREDDQDVAAELGI